MYIVNAIDGKLIIVIFTSQFLLPVIKKKLSTLEVFGRGRITFFVMAYLRVPGRKASCLNDLYISYLTQHRVHAKSLAMIQMPFDTYVGTMLQF